MPSGVKVTRTNRTGARRDGQVRLWWDDTPVDLFLDTHEFHSRVAQEVREVPFEGRTIPVLGCVALMVFKALFGRPRDWADIEDMLHAGRTTGPRALEQVRELLGPGDPVAYRLTGLTRS